MELWLANLCSRDDYTHGVLIDRTRSATDGNFLCAILQDEKRNIKIAGETRIPAGRYEIELRREGGQHEKYRKLFPEFHVGMLHVKNVPNFEWINIHPGNEDDDTDGCLCPGYETYWTKNWQGRSVDAYKDVYKVISGALLDQEPVWLTVEDIA